MANTAYGALCSVLMQVNQVEFAPQIGARRRQIDKHWYEVLVGERLPSSRPYKQTPRQVFLTRALNGVLEIDRTFRLLRDLEIYISYAPRFPRGPSKLTYLNYHVESHLHELYILRERLDRFMTFLERAYRKDRGARRIAVTCRRVRRAVQRVLGSAVKVRGEHVHQKRLRVPDIERLEFVEELARHAPSNLKGNLSRRLNADYRKVRIERRAHMREMNGACAELLEFMAANVLTILLRRNMTMFTFPPGMVEPDISFKSRAESATEPGP